jgi:hypothetical protein
MVKRMAFGAVAFAVADVQRMVAQQVLPEDSTVELLDGAIVHRDRFDLEAGEVVPGIEHDFVVGALADLNGSIKTEARHIRTENTLVCGPNHAPIPDACILRGTLRDYATRFPTAADAWSVVEVADRSYERDAAEKLAGYARAGVGQYVIINFHTRAAEVQTSPLADAGTYSGEIVHGEGDKLSLQVGLSQFFEVPLTNLLP